MKDNNMMTHGRIWQVLMGVGLALCFVSIFVGMALLPGPVHGEGRVKPEWVMPRHYPHGFHGMGYIDGITEAQVVIDEHLIKLSPDVEYNTPTEKNAPKAIFKPGKRVGYLLNSKNEIRSLWLIERE